MQLLWINLVTDSFPAVSLGMEAVENDVMDVPPKPKNEGIFAHGLGLRVVLQGVMFALLTLAGFVIGERFAGEAGGRTMAFTVLSLSQIVQAYNMRTEHSLFKAGFFGNRKLNLSCLLFFSCCLRPQIRCLRFLTCRIISISAHSDFLSFRLL